MLTFDSTGAAAIASAALEAGPRLLPYSTRQVYSYRGSAGELAIYLHKEAPHRYLATVTDATQEQLTEAPLQGFGVTENLAIVAALTGRPTMPVISDTEATNLMF